MAQGRKGSKARDEVSEASEGIAAPRPDIVDTVRGLAAVVADHALTELIVDLPEATITLRRGSPSAVAMPAMPMGMPAGLPMPAMAPMAMPAPIIHGNTPSAAAAAAAAAGGAPAVDDKAHV